MDIESEMKEGTVAHGDVKNAMSLCSSLVSVPGKCIVLKLEIGDSQGAKDGDVLSKKLKNRPAGQISEYFNHHFNRNQGSLESV